MPESERGQILTAHFVRRWEGDLSDHVLVMLLRSAVTNPRVADQLRVVASQQMASVLEPIVASSELVRRAGLVASQMIGVALTRYILALPGIADQPPERLIADIAPTIQRYLQGPLENPDTKNV